MAKGVPVTTNAKALIKTLHQQQMSIDDAHTTVLTAFPKCNGQATL